LSSLLDTFLEIRKLTMSSQEEISNDPELEDLYISLDRVDVHCSLVSIKVLSLLSDPLPPSPPGGMVILEPGPGVFCDNAMTSLITTITPKPDKERKKRWFKGAMAELNKVGITGAGDAGVRPDDIAIMEEVAEAGETTMRVRVMLECDERNTFCPADARRLEFMQNGKPQFVRDMLLNGGVKLFADGALGSRGAALLEPYDDDPSTSGTMLIAQNELTEVVKQVSSVIFKRN
jgi:predicted amidohydrolase YtcJ